MLLSCTVLMYCLIWVFCNVVFDTVLIHHCVTMFSCIVLWRCSLVLFLALYNSYFCFLDLVRTQSSVTLSHCYVVSCQSLTLLYSLFFALLYLCLTKVMAFTLIRVMPIACATSHLYSVVSLLMHYLLHEHLIYASFVYALCRYVDLWICALSRELPTSTRPSSKERRWCRLMKWPRGWPQQVP